MADAEWQAGAGDNRKRTWKATLTPTDEDTAVLNFGVPMRNVTIQANLGSSDTVRFLANAGGSADEADLQDIYGEDKTESFSDTALGLINALQFTGNITTGTEIFVSASED